LARAADQDRAWQVLERLAQRNSTYLLMVFSVDDLAGINNRFGRGVGDNVLSAFAATLQQAFPEQEVIRWTANEFIVIATDLPTMSARLLVEDVLIAFNARRLKLRGTGAWIGPVTASVGIVANQDDGLKAALARARANALLAAAQGGNRSEG
jgi:diguanylate cyclase